MMFTMQRVGQLSALALFACLVIANSSPATARACSEDEIANVVDDTGRALRDLNNKSERDIGAKLSQLSGQRGWKNTERAQRTQTILSDNRLNQFDREIDVLIDRIDVLGQATDESPTCRRLEAIKQVRDRLISVLGQKSGYVLAKLDTAIQAPSTSFAPTSPAAKEATTNVPFRNSNTSDISVKPPAIAAPHKETANARAQPAPSWSTATLVEPQEIPDTTTHDLALAPSFPPRSVDGYTIDEIRAAGRGVFGTISAELAGVINYAFQRFGHPNGYIVGAEGGGAFLAGLRYGRGKLWLKEYERQKLFWQGPSLGYDVGAAGSRTMFLVYNLKDPGLIFGRFTGVDGSAYFAGGIGITILTNGDVLLVPIRSGLGLRIGANVGYLNFTKRQTWNPF